ncbi:RDD family protein, partial [Micromonospora zhanjiangensis]
GARLAARLIDIGVVLLLNVVVNGWFVWRYAQEVAPVYRAALRSPGTPYTDLPQPGAQADGLMVAILLIAVALWFAYEVPATRNNGQTLGKRLLGVRVVGLGEQAQLSFGQSMRRWNTLGLPVFLWYCCFAGLLLQLVDCAFPLFDRPLRQALHDKRAMTVVVQVPRTPVADPTTRSDDHAETPGGSA